MKKKINFRWIIKIVIWSITLSIVFTLASSAILGNAGYVLAFSALLLFIVLGIAFDVIGVAVTSAEEKPFHSMASHKERGAVEAIRLIKNAEKVSSFCNDVVGDISGIISGTTAAVVVERLTQDLSAPNLILQLAVSGLVAGLTIGGKAMGKTFAMNKSTDIVLFAAKIINFASNLFHKSKRG